MSSERQVRTFSRIEQYNPPAREDMLSYSALGLVPDTDNPETLRLATGVSVFSTLQQARNQMRRLPSTRRSLIAELRISASAPVIIERTGAQRGHHTLWGSPDDILSYVARVILPEDTGTGGTR